MNIAEFFVLLGVKGGDSSLKAVRGVDGALKEVRSTSLQTKAAILGVIYGLERMMSQSMKSGTGLKQLADYTKLSAQEIQRWQFAGKQFGVEAEETAGAIKSVQSAIAQMRMGMGAPAGMGMVDQLVGLEDAKVDNAFYMLQKLQEFAQKAQGPVANEILQSFGVSEKMIAAMRNNAFNPDIMAKAQVYSDKQLESLNKTNAMWGNLGDKMQKAFGAFTSKNGQQIVSTITQLANSFINLGQAILDVSEKFKLFDLLGKSITGWVTILNAMSGKGKIKGDFSAGGVMDFFKGLNIQDQEEMQKYIEAEKQKIESGEAKGWLIDLIREKQLQQQNQSAPSSSIQINQEMYFNGDGSNAGEVALENRRVLNQTVRQLTAQGQVS